MNIINKRRSVRTYNDKVVEKEKIELLLKAAMQAPSAGNQQPWEFVVVTDKELLKQLSQVSPYASMLENAPLGIIVLGNNKTLRYPGHIEQDLGACTQNILLEATHLNLGSVWLGVAPDDSRMKYISDVLKLPKHLLPFAAVSIGYPATTGANTFINRFDRSRVHYNRYE